MGCSSTKSSFQHEFNLESISVDVSARYRNSAAAISEFGDGESGDDGKICVRAIVPAAFGIRTYWSLQHSLALGMRGRSTLLW